MSIKMFTKIRLTLCTVVGQQFLVQRSSFLENEKLQTGRAEVLTSFVLAFCASSSTSFCLYFGD